MFDYFYLFICFKTGRKEEGNNLNKLLFRQSTTITRSLISPNNIDAPKN